jgi:hypothetical protein
MGTRAVVKCNNRVWIATHWDSYPKKSGLGQSLLKELRKKFTVDEGDQQYFDVSRSSEANKACWKAAADHSIDQATTQGSLEFDKIYGDYAEYEYRIVHDENGSKCSKVQYRKLDGEWKGSQTSNGWKDLGKVCMKVRKKRTPRRKKPGC